jgi:uncharacterized iron-regulated membrane protein
MSLRRSLASIHRWIGLASGIIVFIVGLTGAVFVWEAELFAMANRDLVRVAPSGPALSPEQLIEVGRGALPADRPVTRLTLLGDPTRAAVLDAVKTTPGARTFFSEYQYYDEVYVNQYTGQVLGVVDRHHHWLYITRHIHTSLLLAQVGEWIVGGATIAFLGLCIVGLVLWWPRNAAILKSRLVPRLTGSWKRAVFDGHNILGFYGLAGLLIFGITGPVWSFPWYQNAIAWTLTGVARVIAQPVPTPEPGPTPVERPFTTALASGREFVPNGKKYMIDVPPNPSRLLTVGITYDGGSFWDEYERYYFHPLSGELLGDERFEEKNLGMKWRNTNYSIHTGTIFGWPTQVFATLICLLTASLPITGVLVWYPRWARRRAGRRAGER